MALPEYTKKVVTPPETSQLKEDCDVYNSTNLSGGNLREIAREKLEQEALRVSLLGYPYTAFDTVQGVIVDPNDEKRSLISDE